MVPLKIHRSPADRRSFEYSGNADLQVPVRPGSATREVFFFKEMALFEIFRGRPTSIHFRVSSWPPKFTWPNYGYLQMCPVASFLRTVTGGFPPYRSRTHEPFMSPQFVHLLNVVNLFIIRNNICIIYIFVIHLPIYLFVYSCMYLSILYSSIHYLCIYLFTNLFISHIMSE